MVRYTSMQYNLYTSVYLVYDSRVVTELGLFNKTAE